MTHPDRPTLTGKVAVITGGSRGIGFATALQLATDGADCFLAAQSEDRLKDAAARIADQTGRRVEYHAADLRTLEGCGSLLEAAESAYKTTDILINCAGAARGGPFLELTDDIWEDGFALKFYSAVRLSRLFWPHLAAARGTVINIVGSRARTPAADEMIGGAVNAALANFTKALAGQGLRDDINVNIVHPGMTRTERLQEIFEYRARTHGTTPEEFEAQMIAASGIRRVGQPEDVAQLVAYLCSPAARQIHGAAIAIDGGATEGLY
jgi:3-oxoacyl-[acyl-carrier protein] reductase